MSYKNELQGNNADLQLALDKVRNLPEKMTLPTLSNPAGAERILEGYQGVDGEGKLITGSMIDNGAVSSTLNAGNSYTIPEGYHNGTGKITANSLASQTSGTATAADIASGLTAWVNGAKLTGTKGEGYKVVVGTKELTSAVSTFSVTGLDFAPEGIVILCDEISIYSTHTTACIATKDNTQLKAYHMQNSQCLYEQGSSYVSATFTSNSVSVSLVGYQPSRFTYYYNVNDRGTHTYIIWGK